MDGQQIVVLLDGSLVAEEALRYVTRLFAPVQVRIALVHVLPVGTEGDQNHQVEQNARAYLDMAAWQLEDGGYEVKTFVLYGSPPEVIVQFARAIEARLIVMTSHGQGQSVTIPAGTTAASVLATAECPVLIVPVRDQIKAAPVQQEHRVAA